MTFLFTFSFIWKKKKDKKNKYEKDLDLWSLSLNMSFKKEFCFSSTITLKSREDQNFKSTSLQDLITKKIPKQKKNLSYFFREISLTIKLRKKLKPKPLTILVHSLSRDDIFPLYMALLLIIVTSKLAQFSYTNSGR